VALTRGPQELEAIVFDVDGTLYRQDQLRRRMLVHLVRSHAMRPVRGWRTARVLQAYRRAQEDLRVLNATEDIAGAQVTRTCERTGAQRDTVVEWVNRWMEQEPLAFLAECIQPGLREFLNACKARGQRLGALSDYPAEAKLEALGIAPFFDVVLCAQDPAIDCFKPNPRGLLVALTRLGSLASKSLYVGDRLDVDAPTAKAAGTRCAIVTRHGAPTQSDTPLVVPSFSKLQALLFA
jgi:FMN phosphatase YigB (HAD superfamily)